MLLIPLFQLVVLLMHAKQLKILQLVYWRTYDKRFCYWR